VKKHAAGSFGATGHSDRLIEDCAIPSDWKPIVARLANRGTLRPVQHEAVCGHKILESRRNLVVSAPTNAGKSLVGHLVLLDAAMRGRRAVLLEPLRALAQEQAEHLQDRLKGLPLGPQRTNPRVIISTGDYRIEDETMSSLPPDTGEIVVATPERFDAILRNPATQPWVDKIGALVVDEAHLIADSRRGPVLELVVASLAALPSPPRIALLSATIGTPSRLPEWLDPCDIIESTIRTPLEQEVWELAEGESADDVLAEEVQRALSDPAAAVLVFTYTRAMTDSLATRLTQAVGHPVSAYHSGLSAAMRGRVRQDFLTGQCRCLVSTTALAMGVNLPATHVFVRDTQFFGHGRLQIGELVQILGRAGRGDRSGVAAVIVRPQDDWNAAELSRELAAPQLAPLRSAFEVPFHQSSIRAPDRPDNTCLAGPIVAACLARTQDDGTTAAALSKLLGRTLAGETLALATTPALRKLALPEMALAYENADGLWRLTKLGLAGVRACLPLPYLAALGQLVRDLLSLDDSIRLLGRWTTLDHLFLASLASERTPTLRRFSEPLADQIDGWHEAQPGSSKSLLFTEWVAGSETGSKADELLGSLSEVVGQPCPPRKLARQRAYVAMLNALVLLERSRGVTVPNLDERWRLSLDASGEEGWRDTVIWLVAGHAAIFDVRVFYFHLKEACAASQDQIAEIKEVLQAIRRQAIELLDELKYCSPLGPVLLSLRRTRRHASSKTVGQGTIKKLEDAGVTSLRQLAGMTEDDLIGLGIRRAYASQISEYIKRRSR
jgi:helicase